MAEQKKMWVISSGDYSDYCVHAACETEEVAKVVAAKMNVLENTSYEEYEAEEVPVIDESVHKVIVYRMSVEILDDGCTGAERQLESTQWSFHPDAPEVAWRWVRAPYIAKRGGRLDVWGTDQERVRKVLGDQRAMLMADDAYRARSEMKSATR